MYGSTVTIATPQDTMTMTGTGVFEGATYDRLDGWEAARDADLKKTKRPSRMGDYTPSGSTLPGRVVTIEGQYFGSSIVDAARMRERLVALYAAGAPVTMTVADPLRTTSRLCFVEDVDPKWSSTPNLKFTIDLYAPDPRRYGAERPATTVLASPGSGLALPGDEATGRGLLLPGRTLASTRTNLVANPSFEASSGSWTQAAGGASVSRVADTIVGAWALRHEATAAGASIIWPSALADYVAVSAGVPVALSVSAKALTRLAPLDMYIVWRTAAGTSITPFPVAASVTPGALGAVVRLSLVATPPEGAVNAQIALRQPSAQIGDVVHWDAILVESSSAAGTYFDGSTPSIDDDVVYTWAGTAHASESIERTYTGDDLGLDFGSTPVDGRVLVTNEGTAEAPFVVAVTGGTMSDGFEVVEVETGRRMVYVGPVVAGTVVSLESELETAFVNDAPAGRYVASSEWWQLAPLSSSTLHFLPRGAVSGTPTMTVTTRPAFY